MALEWISDTHIYLGYLNKDLQIYLLQFFRFYEQTWTRHHMRHVKVTPDLISFLIAYRENRVLSYFSNSYEFVTSNMMTAAAYGNIQVLKECLKLLYTPADKLLAYIQSVIYDRNEASILLLKYDTQDINVNSLIISGTALTGNIRLCHKLPVLTPMYWMREMLERADIPILEYIYDIYGRIPGDFAELWNFRNSNIDGFVRFLILGKPRMEPDYYVILSDLRISESTITDILPSDFRVVGIVLFQYNSETKYTDIKARYKFLSKYGLEYPSPVRLYYIYYSLCDYELHNLLADQDDVIQILGYVLNKHDYHVTNKLIKYLASTGKTWNVQFDLQKYERDDITLLSAMVEANWVPTTAEVVGWIKKKSGIATYIETNYRDFPIEKIQDYADAWVALDKRVPDIMRKLARKKN